MIKGFLNVFFSSTCKKKPFKSWSKPFFWRPISFGFWMYFWVGSFVSSEVMGLGLIKLKPFRGHRRRTSFWISPRAQGRPWWRALDSSWGSVSDQGVSTAAIVVKPVGQWSCVELCGACDFSILPGIGWHLPKQLLCHRGPPRCMLLDLFKAPGYVSVFVVNSRALVSQQAEYLKTHSLKRLVVGDLGPPHPDVTWLQWNRPLLQKLQDFSNILSLSILVISCYPCSSLLFLLYSWCIPVIPFVSC